MGFFSRKVTTDKITESMASSFDAMVVGLKNSIKDEVGSISEAQNKELIAISMFAIIRVVLVAFSDTSQAQNIVGKFQHDIFSRYFKELGESEQFGDMLWRRCDEYIKVLNPENKDFAIKVGEIFCTHFFDKEEDGSHFAITMIVGSSFLIIMNETKKFLDEVLSKYEVV